MGHVGADIIAMCIWPGRPSSPSMVCAPPLPPSLPLRLAQATGFLIPVSPLLLEMLHWAELQKTPKAAQGGSGAFTPDMALQLRAGSSVLRTPGFQEEVVTQVWNVWKCVWRGCVTVLLSASPLSLSREAFPYRRSCPIFVRGLNPPLYPLLPPFGSRSKSCCATTWPSGPAPSPSRSWRTWRCCSCAAL